MNRRSILGAAAAAPVLAAPAIAQTQNPEIRWRLQSSFPKNLESCSSAPSRSAGAWRS